MRKTNPISVPTVTDKAIGRELLKLLYVETTSIPGITISPKPIKKIVEDISDLSLDDSAKDMGIEIQSGGMVNGKYDWILVFTAKDVKQATKFKGVFLSKYSSIVSEVDFLEYIFPIKKCGVPNPDVKKLNDMF